MDDTKKSEAILLRDLAPTDPLMHGAWVGGLHHALGNPEILAAFRAETGNRWTPGRTPIETMIDEATGADRAFIMAFARWFNEHAWGEVDGRAGNGNEGAI